MLTSKLLRFVSHCLLAALLPCAALADDTDIYINNDSSGGEALVMFSLDYRSNLTSSICSNVGSSCTAANYFRTQEATVPGISAEINALGSLNRFDILRLSLKIVLSQVAGNGLKIGLMFNHNDENACVGYGATKSSKFCSNGGVILMGFRSLLEGDANGALATFNGKLDKLKSLKPASNSPDHVYQGSELFFEFFRYLTGQGIFNGHNGGVDYESGSSVNRNTNTDQAGYPPATWDTAIESGTNYVSPLSSASACSRIFTINFLFQVSQNEADSETAMEASKASGGLGITLPSTQNEFFPRTLEYLNEVDLADGTYGSLAAINGSQNVTSYFFVEPTKINNTTTGYARAGGTGTPFALGDDPEQLVKDLTNIFRQILSVSTTFVAASVPVNVFNRAQLIDNLYIALFQADSLSRPYWNGNVKKLKIVESTLIDGSKQIGLVDAASPPQPAVADDGRIKFDALTYWTDPTTLTDTDVDNNIVAGKDGRHVNRGGAGQKIPGVISGAPGTLNSDTGARQLFYDSGSSLAALNADSTTATALQSSLGAATSTEALALIKYMRGQDVTDIDLDLNLTEARPWIFGDPLHSRPLPINYGATLGYSVSNPAIFLAVGSNDGYLRLIRNTTTGAAQSGQEVWAFMPKNVMGIQRELFLNAIPDTDPPTHPYGFDGTTAVYRDDVNNNGNIDSGDHVYLYAGLRRGGRAYYALDITDPTAPSLLWKIDNTTTGFSELGQAFSTPTTGKIMVGSTETKVVIFAGGYDTNKDYINTSGVGDNDTRGRALYIVNAVTGALIWRADPGGSTGFTSPDTYTHTQLEDSIPSDVRAVDTNGDNLIDRIVVGDTGGRIWRADLTTDGNRANWKLALRANIGRHTTSSEANDRRFFHSPDIVPSQDDDGNFDAIVIGSGDRENPLDKQGLATNFLYMIKDRATGIGGSALTDSTLVHAGIPDVTTACLPNTVCSLDLTAGWKIQLQEGSGEKSLAQPVTLFNTIYFTTYQPPQSEDEDAATCGPSEGSGFLYIVNLDDGTARDNLDVSDDAEGSTGEDANSSGDRNRELSAGGIPSQIVLIPAPSGGVAACTSDLECTKLNVPDYVRTYWQHVEQ